MLVFSGRQAKAKAALAGGSLESFGKAAGLGHGYVYRLNGRESMSLETVNRLARALGCQAADLLVEIQESEIAKMEEQEG
jgi:DNA-binding Xre family transcriptional regulator